MLIKFWLFVKHYWYIPLVLILLLCAFVTYRSKISVLLNVITSARNEHKESLKKLSSAADKRVDEERRAADKHTEDMANVEIEKQKQIEKVLTRIEHREEELQENIDEIARQLRKEFSDD